MHRTRKLSFLLASCMAVPAFAGIIYDESVSGNFSSSGLSPTLVTLSQGSNQILGTNGSGAPSVRDYVTITVPVGLVLDSIKLLDTAIGALGFIGIQAGNPLTLPANTGTAAGLLGWLHYAPADKNQDILALMAVPANGSSGFTPPLPAGTYTLWIQDSSPGLFQYGFDLALATPEPSTWASTLAAAVGVALLLRLRRHPAIRR